MLWAEHLEVLKHHRHLICVHAGETRINEAGASIEKIVVSLDVELVVLIEAFLLLEVILDDEAHVRVRQRNVVIKQ